MVLGKRVGNQSFGLLRLWGVEGLGAQRSGPLVDPRACGMLGLGWI